ncbi:hypothetical protein KR059_010633, partial [Drosophila kikkawai]
VYTEDETNEAMSLIQEFELPMSDLHYALKYVRILHHGGDTQNTHKGLEAPKTPVAEIEPPEFDGDNEEILDRFGIRDL